MIDIAIPKNNEEDFVAIAEKLGYKGLCFLYNYNDYLNKQKNFETKKIKIYRGVLAENKNINKIKSKPKNEKVFVVVRSSSDDRKIMEGSKAHMIFSFEDNIKRDFIHQRASGLNHILCKLANENNIIMGFSLSSILNTENKHVILGRIVQNIKMCRKFKVKTAIASFAKNPYEMKSTHDISSLFYILGFKNPLFLREQDIE
jgi:RNase P/RNase MRP subunit p30|tara:strand:- start:690 stop:1295 length:606 start_codon:yes stop_codon:yes gene_type:complete